MQAKSVKKFSAETTCTSNNAMEPHQRSILMQVVDETRDVFLTLKLKRPSMAAVVEPPMEVIESPMRTARVLKRASVLSNERSMRLTSDDVEVSTVKSSDNEAQT